MTSEGGDPETERTAVTTYVPRYQKRAWSDHAEELGVSRSEFVAMMVQAGRRDLFGEEDGTRPADHEKPVSDDATPGVEGTEDRILRVLRERDHPSWEELVEAVAGDVEDRVESRLGELQRRGRVRYSGRHDGYLLTDGE